MQQKQIFLWQKQLRHVNQACLRYLIDRACVLGNLDTWHASYTGRSNSLPLDVSHSIYDTCGCCCCSSAEEKNLATKLIFLAASAACASLALWSKFAGREAVNNQISRCKQQWPCVKSGACHGMFWATILQEISDYSHDVVLKLGEWLLSGQRQAHDYAVQWFWCMHTKEVEYCLCLYVQKRRRNRGASWLDLCTELYV